MLEHSKSYNFKIFFNLGEGKSIENTPFWKILEVEISTFSSTMVKVKASQISHFRAFKKLIISKFSSTMVKVKALQIGHFRT